MKILVTGGAGLIGSNLVSSLVNEECEVIVVDNLWRGKIENLQGAENKSFDLTKHFFSYDLRNFEKCIEVTKGVDVVVHLADIVGGINYVFGNESFLFRSNMLINSNILAAAISNGVNKLMYVGTACSYPMEKQSDIGQAPLVEEDAYPANPESAYGWSKLLGEYECELAQKEGKIATAILRLHNVYGSPCDLSPDRSQVIPALCRKAIKYPNEKFVVWGSGVQRRAFLHVNDVVRAVLLSLEQGFGVGVIQISPAESHSIGDIARRIVEISGKDIEIVFDRQKPEGDKDRVGDTSKAETLLQWEPQVSLDDGLAQTYEWARQKIETA